MNINTCLLRIYFECLHESFEYILGWGIQNKYTIYSAQTWRNMTNSVGKYIYSITLKVSYLNVLCPVYTTALLLLNILFTPLVRWQLYCPTKAKNLNWEKYYSYFDVQLNELKAYYWKCGSSLVFLYELFFI